MSKKIKSYKELLEEKERLKSLLKFQREQVNADFQAIGQQLQPVKSAMSFAGKIFTRDESNLLVNLGAGAFIELVLKRLFLSNAGWFTRSIIPFFLKNYSSHFGKKSIMKKLLSLVGKKNANGREKTHRD
jgi:hypothetical protein